MREGGEGGGRREEEEEEEGGMGEKYTCTHTHTTAGAC